jgi:hypothetical protein
MAGVMFATARVSTAAPGDFVGTWDNSAPATATIVRIVINKSGAGLAIRVFASCQPTSCDWGSAELTTFGDSPSDADHKYATATYESAFATDELTLRRLPTDMLEVETRTRFHDGSSRQTIQGRGFFKRVPSTLACGQWVQGQIDEVAQQRVHSFMANQGDVAVIILVTGLSQDSGFSAEAELRGPDGKRLDWYLQGRREIEPLPQTGTYTLIIYDSDFRDRGTYALQLWWFHPGYAHCNVVRLALGQLVTGAIVAPAEYDLYTFDATQGDRLFITLLTTEAQDSGFSAEAELRGPDGKLHSRYLHDRRETEPLPQTGTYALIVYDSDFRDRGKYALRVEAVPR